MSIMHSATQIAGEKPILLNQWQMALNNNEQLHYKHLKILFPNCSWTQQLKYSVCVT